VQAKETPSLGTMNEKARLNDVVLRAVNRERAVERLVRTSISFGEASYLRKQVRSELEGQKTYVNYLKRRSRKRYLNVLDEESRTMMRRQERDAERCVRELTSVAEKLDGQVSRLENSILQTRRLFAE